MAHEKSADAFRTISEAADELGVPQHVLRHWEDVFGQIRPMRRAGGRRYYRPLDLDLLRGVKVLLHERRYTTKGVQQIFKEHGARHIAELGRTATTGAAFDLKALVEEASPASTEDGDTSSILNKTPRTATAPMSGDFSLSPPLRERLCTLLARLERVQDVLDEATLALESAEAGIAADEIGGGEVSDDN